MQKRRPCVWLSVLIGIVLTLGSWQSAQAADLAALSHITDQWNALLAKHVKASGGVNYVGLQQDFAALDATIKSYAHLDLKGASDDVKKSAYINLYNATMMFNLLRYAKENNIKVDSKAFADLEINSIKVPGGNIWNGDYTVELSGQKVNLDDIEHNLIRGKGTGDLAPLKVSALDPRIHAAVNCAAVSCPRVREVAYRPETVNKMLDENIREFLSSDAQFHKNSDSQLKANSIVFWYYDDFDDFGKRADKGAGDYLAQFIMPSAPDHDWKVKHLRENFNDRGKISLKLSSAFDFNYDWRVNDIRNKP